MGEQVTLTGNGKRLYLNPLAIASVLEMDDKSEGKPLSKIRLNNGETHIVEETFTAVVLGVWSSTRALLHIEPKPIDAPTAP